MFGFNFEVVRIEFWICRIDSDLFGFLKIELILSPELIILEVRNRSF
jgi:hypothetical protein